GQAVAEGTAASTGAAAPPPVSGVEPGSPVSTSYLVFVDNSGTVVTRDRDIVIQGLIEQLSQLRREDRMAVVLFDGVRPALVSNWSQSPADLRKALERVKNERPHGLVREADAGNLGNEAGL